MFHKYFDKPTWYILKGSAGFIPKGNITANENPETFDNESDWKARCKQLGIDDENE